LERRRYSQVVVIGILQTNSKKIHTIKRFQMRAIMKLFLISVTFMLVSNYLMAQDKDELPGSTIYFVRHGNPLYAGFMMDLVLPHQRQFSIGSNTVVKYKIYSEGEVNVTLDILGTRNGDPYQMTRQVSINVTSGKDYYVLCSVKSIESVEKSEVEKMIAKCKNIIKQEENIEVPIIPSSIRNAAKKNGKGQGTCFLISPEGYVVTNFHCIENAKEITIKGIDGDFTTKYGAIVIASDPSNDLALLKLSNKTLKFDSPPFAVRSGGVAQAEKVYALGYPVADAMGTEMKITDGIISAKSGLQGDISKFQISAVVNPGESGGPLLDEQGNLVGVIYAKSTVAEAAGYAVKASYLETFLNNVDGFNFPSLMNTLKDKPLTEKVAIMKTFIFILESN
jgi:S1-C subfamily serine protease